MRACVHVSDVRVWTCNQTFTWLSVSSSWHHISPRKKKEKESDISLMFAFGTPTSHMKYQYQSFSAIPEKNKKMAPIPWRHNSGHSKGIVYVKRKPLKYTANLSLTHLYPYTYYPSPLLPSLFHSLRPLIHKKKKKIIGVSDIVVAGTQASRGCQLPIRNSLSSRRIACLTIDTKNVCISVTKTYRNNKIE